MSTEKENVTAEQAAPVEMAGDLLRKKREKLGISQQEIADRLRLRVSVIENIDSNNFEFDHVATFTRGYLRSYAKAVGLDDKMVLAVLDGMGDAQHGPQSMQSFSRKTKRDKHDSRIMKLSWVIFAIIFGISAMWWYQNNQQDTLAETSPVEPAEPVVVQEEVVEQEKKTTSSNNLSATTPEPEAVLRAKEQRAKTQEPVTEMPVAPESEEPAVEAVTEEAAIEDVVVLEPTVIEEDTAEKVTTPLVMNFSADCWIQVKDATGKTLATGVKKAGYNLKVEGELPYSVILGAPEGVSMTLSSEPVDLSGYTSGKVARFTLP